MVKKIKLENGKLSITDNIDLVYEKIITKFGTGAKIDAPKEFTGRRVIVLVEKERVKKSK